MDVERVDVKPEDGQHVPTSILTANCDYQATEYVKLDYLTI